MSTISRIKISGFRRLRDIDLEMRPLMVMIGPNGAGKTSLLDAFSLLAASASGNLNSKLSQMGGITSVLTSGRARELYFTIDMEIPGHNPLKYEIHLAPAAISFSIASETLTQDRPGHYSPFKHIDSHYTDIQYFEIEENRLQRPTWEHNFFETSLSQVPKMFKQPEDLRSILSSTALYHVLDVGERAPVKLPQKMSLAEFPGDQGENLIPYLYYLRESNNKRYETIMDTLHSAFDGFEFLSFPPVASGLLTMTWKEKHFPEPLYAHQLSEGTLRFLWLVSLLQSPRLPTITMIDEPEVSLHPELLSLLADLMREASQRTQLIVATHSDRLVRFLKPNEVVVMDLKEDGSAAATWADSLNLEKWLADYTLDEVWRMGRMGGRS